MLLHVLYKAHTLGGWHNVNNRKPTLKDVANAMTHPVSIGKLSLALRGLPGVALATREEALEAARTVEYPIPAISSEFLLAPSRGRKQPRIGVCIPDLSGGAYYQELIRDVTLAGSRAGFEVVPQVTDDDSAERSAANLYKLIGVVAVIFLSSRISDKHFRQLADNREVLLIGIGSPRPDDDFGDILIDIDHRYGMYEATEYLIESGHEQIAFFSGPQNSASNKEKKNGIESALADHGLSLRRDFVFTPANSAFGYASGSQLIVEVMSQVAKPNAILTYNDELAIGAIFALQRANVRVPGDIAVIGYDDIPVSSYQNPRVTSVGVARTDLAQCAVNIIKRSVFDKMVVENPEPFKPVLHRRASSEQI